MTDNALTFVFVGIFAGAIAFAIYINCIMKLKMQVKRFKRSNKNIVQRTEMIANNLTYSLEESRAQVEKLEREAGKRKPKPQCTGKRIIEI